MHAGKTALIRKCAQALERHPLCRTHVVWVDCREVETSTLAKAKACLLPLVRLSLLESDIDDHLGWSTTYPHQYLGTIVLAPGFVWRSTRR